MKRKKKTKSLLKSILLKAVSFLQQKPKKTKRQKRKKKTTAIVIQKQETETLVKRNEYTTSDFLQPSEALKRSIEAFILDQRSHHTRVAYRKDLKRFVEFLWIRKHGFGIETLNRSILIAYKEALLADQLEHTTVDRHISTLKSFFQWLVEDGLLEKSPASGVRFLNPKRLSKTNGFSDEEVMAVLREPNLHTKVGALHYAILMVLFYCGLRRSEVCALIGSNLGIEQGHCVLRLLGKGNAERIIPLIPPVIHAIEYYLKIAQRILSAEDPVFCPIRNNRTRDIKKPLDSSSIFYIVKKYAKKAGILHKVSPHSCRATAISNARDHNVADRAIQEFAGWSSPNMIVWYDKRKSAVQDSAAFGIYYEASEESGRSFQEREK